LSLLDLEANEGLNILIPTNYIIDNPLDRQDILRLLYRHFCLPLRGYVSRPSRLAVSLECWTIFYKI